MPRKFDQGMSALKAKLLQMGGLVESMVQKAMGALVERDERRIEEVVKDEERVDRLQIEIDEDAVRLLAIQSPVAFDLRCVLMSARINSELERVGDLCVNMCENVQLLLSEPQLKPLIDLPKMAQVAERMLHESLQAFLEQSPQRAVDVIRMDDEVDGLNDQIFRELLTYMIADTRSITRSLSLILMSRNLERIADHATNIAEEVVYLVRGEDIRHKPPPAAGVGG